MCSEMLSGVANAGPPTSETSTPKQTASKAKRGTRLKNDSFRIEQKIPDRRRLYTAALYALRTRCEWNVTGGLGRRGRREGRRGNASVLRLTPRFDVQVPERVALVVHCIGVRPGRHRFVRHMRVRCDVRGLPAVRLQEVEPLWSVRLVVDEDQRVDLREE